MNDETVVDTILLAAGVCALISIGAIWKKHAMKKVLKEATKKST